MEDEMTLCGEDRDIASMNNELNHLYQRIHASPAITADLPENLGMGRIIRAVSPCGTVVSSWKMKFGSDAAVEGNVKDEIRLLFCMGEGAAWASERRIMRIDRNEACLILDHGEVQSMCYASDMQYEFWSISLQRERLFSMLAGYVPDPCKVITELKYRRIAFTPEIREGLLGSEQLLKESDKGFGMMRLEAYTQELIALCLDAAAGGECGRKGHHADDADIIRQVKSRIDHDPGSVPGIADLATQYGFSISKLSRLFRQMYNIPLHAYVIERRLCEGARLLSEGKLSVGEVAWRVGYAKQSQFTAAFKRRFHILPRDY